MKTNHLPGCNIGIRDKSIVKNPIGRVIDGDLLIDNDEETKQICKEAKIVLTDADSADDKDNE